MRYIIIVGLLLLAACGATPEQRLATTCSGLAANYRTAVTLRQQNKLPANVDAEMSSSASSVKAMCDPLQPAANLDLSNAQASALLVQFTTDLARVK